MRALAADCEVLSTGVWALGKITTRIRSEQECIDTVFTSLEVRDATYAKVFGQTPVIERENSARPKMEVAGTSSAVPLVVTQLAALEEKRTRFAKLVRAIKAWIAPGIDENPNRPAGQTWTSISATEVGAISWVSCKGFPESTQYFEDLRRLQTYEIEICEYRPESWLKRMLAFCRRQLLQTSIRIAAIKKWLYSAVAIFCCVRWERRRWFVYHGARPPKEPGQVITSLFAGACFSLVLP